MSWFGETMFGKTVLARSGHGVLAAALVIAWSAGAGAADEPGRFTCAMQGTAMLTLCTPAPAISPDKPQNKALVIFVQYVNENPHPASPCWNGWPVGQVPVWAESLIAPTTDPQEFPVGSMNDYFYTMSGGKHVVYGDFYHQMVTLDYWAQWYRDQATLGYMCQEIIDKVDPFIQFADYDVDPVDGVVDMVCILSRSELPWGWQGASYFGRETLTTDDFQGPTPITLNGCYPGSGTIQFSPNHIGALQTIVHEYMHQVFVPGSHIPSSPYAFPGDDFHLNYLSSYGLMDGNGQGTTMSAFERAWIGWVSPVLVEQTTYGVPIPDAATTGSVFKILVAPGEPDEYFLIENRQRLWYGELEQGDHGPTECCNNELESTGLMIYHVDVRDLPGEFPEPARKKVDIEAADGMFDPGTGLPDPATGLDDLDNPGSPACQADTVGTDAFGPGIATAFTPSTNPNSDAYVYGAPFGPWAQVGGSGIRVQNIRYDPDDPAGKRMLADFVIQR